MGARGGGRRQMTSRGAVAAAGHCPGPEAVWALECSWSWRGPLRGPVLPFWDGDPHLIRCSQWALQPAIAPKVNSSIRLCALRLFVQPCGMWVRVAAFGAMPRCALQPCKTLNILSIYTTNESCSINHCRYFKITHHNAAIASRAPLQLPKWPQIFPITICSNPTMWFLQCLPL